MTLDEAIAAKRAALDEFVELCRRGREDPQGVHVREFGANFTRHQDAAAAEWDGWFRNIANTGVRVRTD